MAGTPNQIAIRAGLREARQYPADVTPADFEAVARVGRAARGDQRLLARALLRQALFDATGMAGDLWRIERAPDGRPLAVAPDGKPGPDVSVAHSGPYAIAGVAMAMRIGVDIETPRPGRNWRAIAEAYFSADERALAEARGEGGFLALWTLREAIGKAAGGGMARALSLDGVPLPSAVGDAARLSVDGTPCVVAQRGIGPVQLAVACLGAATEAVVAAALDAACASIQSAT